MTPSVRSLPIVTATFSEIRRAWVVELPGRVEIAVPQAVDVEPMVARYAPGSSVRFVNPSATSIRPNTAADAGSA